MKTTLWTIGLGLILASILPLAPSDDWWIRALDFPRPLIALLICIETTLAWLFLDRRRWPGHILLAGLLVALGLQLLRLWPYTPLHSAELPATAACPADERLSIVVSNLRAGNSGAARFLEAVRRAEPDVVFVVEVDSDWVHALQPLEAHYPHRLLHPRADFWGFALYSRLALRDAETRHLLSSYVPSVQAGLRLRSGAEVGFHGLHPKPPVPGEGTGQRDAELLLAAEALRRAGRPALLAGDLNTVGWSATSLLVQRIGGLLDPRVGRGPHTTFPTWLPEPLRVPIDHVLVTPGFRLLGLRRLIDIGSDHLPLFAALCHVPEGALDGSVQPQQPSDGDRRWAREAIADGREDAARTGD
ncbi:endonuclease/exonuclease/phosphatase family protein [Dankookia sp. GCM10030260]|uniref:endonuclease/exonuclease/phosphatase family protein n=1 Tax=Dankookia sp. GCM10030260 TaxID=3273390 RepID=UPI003612D4A0